MSMTLVLKDGEGGASSAAPVEDSGGCSWHISEERVVMRMRRCGEMDTSAWITEERVCMYCFVSSGLGSIESRMIRQEG